MVRAIFLPSIDFHIPEKMGYITSMMQWCGYPLVLQFLGYFKKTYLNDPFPITLWNQFDNDGDRTNDRVEGENAKMKKFWWSCTT